MRRMLSGGRPRTVCAAVLAALMLVWGCSSENNPTNPDPDPDPTPTNQPPSAAAGADLAVAVGFAVSVDGSASTDPDGDALTYAWTLAAPAGSAAALDDGTSATPSFVPDVEGVYTLSLTVNDGTDDSSPDAATVTATDNTVTASVASASGGSMVSSDGALELSVPAGALAADTDISVTSLAAVQIPESLRDLPGELSVYDLQPDGTTFSTPAEVSFDVDGAVTVTDASTEMAVPFLISESGGSIESMSDVVVAQDDVDPTGATISGGLSHFSHAVFASRSMTFRIEAPDEARVDEPFDVTFTLDLTGLTDPTFTAFTTFLDDRSEAPFQPEEQGVFRQDFPTGESVSVIANSYECTEEGTGDIAVALEFASPPLVALIHLATEVTCTVPPPPLETTLIPNLYRAWRLLPVPGSDDEITTGGLVRRVNLTTGAVTELSEAGADPPEFVFALSDGNYLVHTLLGSVHRFLAGAEQQIDTMLVTWYDQARHVAPVNENTLAVATAFGDLGFMTYTPGLTTQAFQDPFRDLESRNNPQQDPPTNLQAIWVSSDAETFVGVVTEGDGDSAFNDSRAVLIDADVQSGQLSTIVLPGIIDRILDPVARHQFDLECGELEGSVTSDLLCVFTSGFDGPAFESSIVDLENDGFVAIFTVDTFDQTAELLYSNVGNARVGTGIFPFDGSTTGVAVANQLTGEIDVWHVQDAEVSASFSLSVDGQCPAPIDLILLGFGARGALACQSTSAPDYSVLVIENLDFQQPPIS